MKVGDKVVCVRPIDRLVKDNSYTIMDTFIMPCGCVAVDVGFGSIKLTSGCLKHGTTRSADGVRWFASTRFAPIISRSDEFLSSDKIEKSAEERIDIELPITV